MNYAELDGRSVRLSGATQRDRPAGGNSGGRPQGGNFSGRPQGGGGGRFQGGNNRNPGNSSVVLSQDDKNAKKGAIGGFAGKKITL